MATNFKDFEDYVASLKLESERGAVPNHRIPLAKFIQVARNILKKIDESKPTAGMIF
jgi:hypothetical protein